MVVEGVTALSTQPLDGRVRGVIGAGSIAQMSHLPVPSRPGPPVRHHRALRYRQRHAQTSSARVVRRLARGRFKNNYWDACASDGVDAVVVCPNGSHVPQGIRRAGARQARPGREAAVLP